MVRSMKFIDLFAGLGGFHLALENLGHECVFASELDKDLQNTYNLNFGLMPHGDIRSIPEAKIPKHHILCAGFPCQPFSKAGEQLGQNCPQWGDLFGEHVLRIIRSKKPKYFLLENVANLERHDSGNTWVQMKSRLEGCGYHVQSKILSPHRFGIPQIRERLFIVGSKKSLRNFKWPEENCAPVTIESILDKMPKDAKPISTQVENCLNVWQDFLDSCPKSEAIPSFPIWTMEFGATYPYENSTPFSVGTRQLCKYRGTHGINLSTVSPQVRFNYLPSYARNAVAVFPDWKQKFIKQNRDFFERNRDWIEPWLPKIQQFPPSLQKLEWNCKGEKRDIWQYLIQFRASGVRVKRPTTTPSLVAMTTTQVPIIAKEKRYMTPKECMKLQNMEMLKHIPSTESKVYKALGNAVNVKIVQMVAKSLLGTAKFSVT